MTRYTLWLLLVAQFCAAQRLSFGLTGGVQLIEPSPETISPGNLPPSGISLTSATNYESRRYTVGAAIEFEIDRHFAVQFNPLYQRLGTTRTSTILTPALPVSSFLNVRTRANAWEFPVLGKYYFGDRNRTLRAFAGVGPSGETSWQHGVTNATLLDPLLGTPVSLGPVTVSSNTRTAVRPGIVFSGGVLLQKGRVGITPELRYTRWGGTNTAPDARDPNQTEILVTIRIGPARP